MQSTVVIAQKETLLALLETHKIPFLAGDQSGITLLSTGDVIECKENTLETSTAVWFQLAMEIGIDTLAKAIIK